MNTDYILYGGVAAGVVLLMVIVYFIARKKRKGEPKGQVMNKIQDFYSLQDTKKEPNINY